MSARPLSVVIALVAAPVLAGCVAPGGLLSSSSAAPHVADLLASPTSLWPDHQNEPHPAWNWPTLTHPALANGMVPAWWKPIPSANVTKITGLKLVAKDPAGVDRGAGIALFGSLALVPGEGPQSYVVDISHPEAPTLLGKYPVNSSERGAAIMAFPDGRLYGVVSTSPGFDVVNLTDPKNPYVVADVKAPHGGHKLGIVPGTPIVYNANSRGGDSDPLFGVTGDVQSQAKGVIEIYNLSDPEHPQLVKEFHNGYGCHHVFFWNDASKDKYRAICAGIEYTQLIDTKDPVNPKVIVSIPVHHGNPALPATSVPPVMFSHTALLNEDGTILVVGDEFMGGATAECDGVPTPAREVSGPLGDLWFYDVKDEKNPKLLGWFSAPPKEINNPQPTYGCTAHHGRLVPDPEGKRQMLVMGWYGAGVVLVDFTDPTNPRMMDQYNQGTNVWEAWYDNGYVFTGDLAKGIEVLSFK
jgi:hypothetical protein